MSSATTLLCDFRVNLIRKKPSPDHSAAMGRFSNTTTYALFFFASSPINTVNRTVVSKQVRYTDCRMSCVKRKEWPFGATDTHI